MSTHNIPFSNIIKKKITLNYLKSGISFQGTQEGIRNSRGKRAISVRAIEVLLYIVISMCSNFSRTTTVKTLNSGTPRPATVVVLNIKQFNFTRK